MPNFTQLTDDATMRGMTPASRTGHHHRRFPLPPRPDANQTTASSAPMTQPYPLLPRVRLAARIRTPASVTRAHDGDSRTPSSAKRLPMVRATLHAMSSEYTQGLAARYTSTDPPRIVAISTP